MHGEAPSYVKEMLVVKTPTRSLRYSAFIQIRVPASNTKTYEDRVFAKSASALSNKMPSLMKDITTTDTFKLNPKTYLFNLEYE